MTVERHGDHFAPDCPDSDWLAAVSAKGWIALTHDKRIRYKPNELAAVVATSPDVLKFIAAHQPPYIAKVYLTCRVSSDQSLLENGPCGVS